MKFTDHIVIGTYEDCCLLTFWNYDLYGAVYQWLGGQGLDPGYICEACEPQCFEDAPLRHPRYYLLIEPPTTQAQLHAYLAQIGAAEIERIVRDGGTSFDLSPASPPPR